MSSARGTAASLPLNKQTSPEYTITQHEDLQICYQVKGTYKYHLHASHKLVEVNWLYSAGSGCNGIALSIMFQEYTSQLLVQGRRRVLGIVYCGIHTLAGYSVDSFNIPFPSSQEHENKQSCIQLRLKLWYTILCLWRWMSKCMRPLYWSDDAAVHVIFSAWLGTTCEV